MPFISIHLNKGSITSFFISIILMMLFSVSVTAGQIDLSVDKNPIMLSDAIQLTFTATGSPDSDPDFSPLKQDFDIINQQQNSQFSWGNGPTKKTTQWTLKVIAKRSGDIQIPAISFGNDSANSLSITVIETTPLSAIIDEDELYLEVKVSPLQSYVQAQVLYNVLLYQRVNLAQATLSDPTLNNTIVEKLGEDSQYNTKLNGITYLVTERKYALFPQQSGMMTIAPLVLTADIIIQDPRSRRDSFFSQKKIQTKRILSKAITLDVLPAPANFKANHWLPAKQINLKQTWSNSALTVRVGEPITRTLTIVAKGITSSQLPNLATAELKSTLKIYPEKAILNDQGNVNGIVSLREQKIAFIPSTIGNFELPAIVIPWFNTQTQQMEKAQLPAITILAIAAEQDPTLVTSSNDNNIGNDTVTKIQSPQKPALEKNKSTSATNTFWIWSTFAFALAWLITLGLLLRAPVTKPQAKVKIDSQLTANKLKDVIKVLNKACNDNQAQAAQKALIKWSTLSFNTANLAELSHHCNDELQAELQKLNHALYAKQKSAWDGSKLLQAITAQTIPSASNVVTEPLAPLYPSQ